MNTVTLNNGVQMPILGFGVYQIPEDQTEQAVPTPGSRLPLTRHGRRLPERRIRRPCHPEQRHPARRTVRDHEALGPGPGENNTKRAFEASLKRLGLDHVDLYLMHQPYGDYYSQWRAMQDLHEEGLVRAIGVSNFHTDRLMDLITHNDITPAVNQIETHPFYQRQADHDFMREHGVQHESWGPFAEGRNNLFSDPTLTSIATAHGKSVAQLVLRWLIQRDVVVIPKSVRPDRMAENLDVFDFELSAGEMALIAPMDTNASLFFDHRDPRMVSFLGQRRVD